MEFNGGFPKSWGYPKSRKLEPALKRVTWDPPSLQKPPQWLPVSSSRCRIFPLFVAMKNMENTLNCWWFEPTPLKNHGLKVSWDDDIPNMMGKLIHCSKTPTRYGIY